MDKLIEWFFRKRIKLIEDITATNIKRGIIIANQLLPSLTTKNLKRIRAEQIK